MSNTAVTTPLRTISEIAREIRANWRPVYFGAVPYLDAMMSLSSVKDTYGCDDAKSIVLYFLCNATTWRGDVARRIKTELKSMTAAVGVDGVRK
jgi:hypothetical protein